MNKCPMVVHPILIILFLILSGCSNPNAANSTIGTYKLAAIFPGYITDADYNSMGYLGSIAVKREYGLDTGYSENIPVDDVDRVIRENINKGFNIIWTHGGQFLDATIAMAGDYPDIVFIAEGDTQPTDLPKNVWFIDRNFYLGFYGLGALAARSTSSGKIGYITGPDLPFTNAEVRAIQQAISDSGKEVEFYPVWTGDFNDPTIAKLKTDELKGMGVDVILGSLNLGMQGVFESVKVPNGHKILVTAKYSDKSQFAPDNYITSLLYDFSKPLVDIVGKIRSGERGGYYPLGFDTGVRLQTPLSNVSLSVMTEMDQIINDLVNGKIQVVKDVNPLQ